MSKTMIGRYVVVRTYSAGVHCGVLLAQEVREVRLATARRIWSWRGANTLSEISQTGLSVSDSRISNEVPEILLTEAIEIIPCSAVGEACLRGARWAE